MIKAHVDGAMTVAQAMRTTEAASADTAIAAATLLVTMLEQHRVMRLDDNVGLKAIRHAVRAISLAAEAREEHIRAHGALNIDLRNLGLEQLMSKGGDPPANPAFDWRTMAADNLSPVDQMA